MKKFLSVFLTLTLVLVLAVPVFAAGSTSDNVVGYSADRIEKVTDWSAIPDIMRYDDFAKNPEAYKILNADGLRKLIEVVNLGDTMQGVTIYLAYDIDMTSDKPYTPIGYNRSFEFKGTLDGQGHVIDNMKIIPHGHDNTSGSIGGGLIGYGLGCTVKNLILGSNVTVTCTNKKVEGRLGGIIGNMQGGLVDNCYVLATINGTRYTGGIVGFTDSKEMETIQNCTFGGTVTDIERGPGGILGLASQDATRVTNCRNTGTVISQSATATQWNTIAGGIVGRCWAADLVITGCINNGTVTGMTYAGGILGAQQIKDAEIVDCINYGTVTTTHTFSDADTENGILGQGAIDINVTLTNCVDKVGQTDPTLSTVPTVTPYYPTQAEIDAAHGKKEEDTTITEENTTDPEDNETTASNKDNDTTESTDKTEAVTTGSSADDNKGGCASVFNGMAVILLTAGAGIVFVKKKH